MQVQESINSVASSSLEALKQLLIGSSLLIHGQELISEDHAVTLFNVSLILKLFLLVLSSECSCSPKAANGCSGHNTDHNDHFDHGFVESLLIFELNLELVLNHRVVSPVQHHRQHEISENTNN